MVSENSQQVVLRRIGSISNFRFPQEISHLLRSEQAPGNQFVNTEDLGPLLILLFGNQIQTSTPKEKGFTVV